jgi:hypothetical protein
VTSVTDVINGTVEANLASVSSIGHPVKSLNLPGVARATKFAQL